MLSYTRIKAYQTCPKQYEYKYVQGRTPLPTALMLEGSSEHTKIADTKQVPDFFKSAFEKNFPNPVWEERITADFFTFELQGVIDCYSINNAISCSIADWKLMGIPQDDEQLKVYALLLSKKYPDLEFFTAYFVSIKGGFYRRFTYSKEDIEEFERYLIKVADEITEAKNFLPRPGDHCAYCPFVIDCYKENNLPQELPAITSIDQAIDLGKKVLIAESFLKQVKDKIKDFLLSQGLEELQLDEKNRVYLSPSIALRFGKVNGKSKTRARR